MIIYYIIITFVSLAIVLLSYIAPSSLAFFGNELSPWFANVGMSLLWITLFVKPVFMILGKYSESKTLTFTGLREYLKTIKGRSWKGLGLMLVSIIYFVAGRGIKMRRLLGITTFLAIFTHAGIYIAGRMGTNFVLGHQLQTPYLLAGYIGLLGLFIGYITSNNRSMRYFKGHWKTLQYSAYIALLAAIIHLLLLDAGEYMIHIIRLVIYIALKIIQNKRVK